MLASSWTSLSMDLIVRAGGTPIACNRSALAASSGYFSSQLSLLSSNSTCPPTLDLPSVPADVFRSLLLFIYTGQLEVTGENVYQLFWFSQMLQIPAAVLYCSQFISTRLSSDASLPPPQPPTPQEASAEETKTSEKPRVVKPVARQGVPLLSLTSSFGQHLLRPHLASLYSNWFLHCTTSARLTSQEESQDLTTPPPPTAINSQELKGNDCAGLSLLIKFFGRFDDSRTLRGCPISDAGGPSRHCSL